MEHLPEVETAKALMTEAVAWSVMKWLREKKRVRKTADEANAALDQLSLALKQQWPDQVRAAYASLASPVNGPKIRGNGKAQAIDVQALNLAKKVKHADDEANRARADAEETFDKAERQLSTALAREGCRKAIYSWELHEKAIRHAQAVLRPK
jgi:hypothetical protein